MQADDYGLLAGLDEKPTHVGSSNVQGGANVAPPTSSTVLKVDEWGMRKGSEVCRWAGDMATLCDTIGRKCECDPEAVAADFYAAAFEPNPEFADKPADKARATYMEALMGTGTYRSLHAETRFDVLSSRLASVHFAEGYNAYLVEQEEEQPGNQPGAPGQQPGQSGGQSGDGQSGEQPPQQPEQSVADQMQALSAAKEAVNKAESDLEDLRDMQAGFGSGCGKEAGQTTTGGLEEVQNMFKRVRNSKRLREVIKMAGRYRHVAQSSQRVKVRHGVDDIVGVTIGGEVGQLIPSELAKLATPEFAVDTMRRIVERQAMVRDWHGREPQGKGPIVVITDESGSMNYQNGRLPKAKAISLAIYWIARHQKRGMVFESFSRGDFGRTCVVNANTKPNEVLEYIACAIGGGTDYVIPFEKVPEKWKSYGFPEGSGDVILLTDACFPIPDEVIAKYNAWKKEEKVRLHSIVIDASSEYGGLAECSDVIRFTNNIDHDSDVIGELFSL